MTQAQVRKVTLMGKKRGMTQRFDEAGNAIVCTVIELPPNVVTQVKSVAVDGYDAVQVGYGEVVVSDERTIEKRVSKPLRGHFAKAGVKPVRHLVEFRAENVAQYTPGQAIDLSAFADLGYVDVRATSKGKGFAGVMKRHHFGGGFASHGSGFHRQNGSTGMNEHPGRVLPGMKRAGHMGCERVTTQSLKIVAIDMEKNILFVKGAVPGYQGCVVYVSPAVKKTVNKK